MRSPRTRRLALRALDRMQLLERACAAPFLHERVRACASRRPSARSVHARLVELTSMDPENLAAHGMEPADYVAAFE